MRDIDFNRPDAAELLRGEKDFSGVAVDAADSVKKVTAKEVDSMTKSLNNNHAGDNDLNCCQN